MANWDNLKASVSSIIKTNGANEITGQLLQNVLLSMISNLGKYGTFAGMATPSTNPGATDENAFYVAYQPGNYVNFSGLTIPVNSIAFLTRNGGNWQAEIIGFPVPDIQSQSILDKSYIVDRSIASNGNASNPGSTAMSIYDFPLEPGTYTISGYTPAAGKHFALANTSNEVKPGSVLSLTMPTYTFTVEADGFNLLRFMVKLPSETDTNYINTISLAVGTEAKPPFITTINSNYVLAKYLANDNITPNPTAALNAVNKQYLEANTIIRSRIKSTPSPNLAKSIYRIDGLYIGNNGSKNFVSGWSSFRIPVTPGQNITFGNFSINTAGYSAFYDASDNPEVGGLTNLVLYNGSYTDSSLPRTVTAPTNAAWLYITVKRPVNVEADFAQTIINLGEELIDYVSPLDIITDLDGYTFAGGGSSNVTKFSELTDVPTYLNNGNKALKINAAENAVETYEQVEQNTDVEFNTLTVEALIINDVPIWDEVTLPAPVSQGQRYLFSDGNGNYFEKIKG